MLLNEKTLKITVAFVLCAAACAAQAITPQQKTAIDAKIKVLAHWSTHPDLVAAVKEQNKNPRADAKSMTNDIWKTLTVLDPFVRSFSKSPAAHVIKAKKEDFVTECFLSAADGTKVAFLAKTTSYTHAGKDKHKIPMTGKIWTGPLEIDESTGLRQVQVGLPMLDGVTTIGSIVFGLDITKLN